MVSVLFISHSKRGAFYYNDASARYRCIFPAEHLNELGVRSHVIHFQQLNKIELTEYSHAIFHRPKYNSHLKRTLKTLKKLKIKAICDFDDLLFNPKLATNSAAVQSGYMSIKLAQKQANSYQKALNLFSFCWASTDSLAQELHRCHPTSKVTVCHNKMSFRWTKLAQPLEPRTRLRNKVIRYMPGTSHHKHDFAKIQNWLADLLYNNPDINLEIIGDLKFNKELFPVNQVSQQDFVPYESLPGLISNSWLTLAPLEENIFNKCKSALKFWESGIFNVPVISSPLPDMKRFKNPSLCLSKNLDDWNDFIISMKDEATYINASQNSYKKAEQAVFNINEKDIRLSSLQLEPTPNIEKSRPNNQHYEQHLIMCEQFGPRWPAIRLNPTDINYKETNKLIKGSLNIELSIDHKKRLEEELINKIKKDLPNKRSSFVRKIKKLWNSPREFFKDIK